MQAEVDFQVRVGDRVLVRLGGSLDQSFLETKPGEPATALRPVDKLAMEVHRFLIAHAVASDES